MHGFISWVRSFTYDKNGQAIKDANGNFVFAAHPQPNLWRLLAANAKDIANNFDLTQLAPAFNGPGEGYSSHCFRNYNSNWGTEAELIACIIILHALGVAVSTDMTYRQMSGDKPVGVITYTDFAGSTSPNWFQNFGQPGESTPPLVVKDDVPNPTGNFAFGRVRTLQRTRAALDDVIDALNDFCTKMGLVPGHDIPRWDDGKGMWYPGVLEIMNTKKGLGFVVEYDSGDANELDWYLINLMQRRVYVEDYGQYWNTQRACNNYRATEFDAGSGGYWRKNPAGSFIFTDNPDVSTSWSKTGGINQQIAFNLLLGIMHDMFLPCKAYLTYSQNYYPASPDYPTGRGFKPYIDNGSWFQRKFAYGNFERRYVDNDVYAYTRDGDGGSIGRSAGCLVVTNFNTLAARYLELQTMWRNIWVHNYSMTGHNEDYYIGSDGIWRGTVKSNAYSNGQSYLLIAEKGVSGSIVLPPINK